MNVAAVLFMLLLISALGSQLLIDAIHTHKNTLSFYAYAERLYKAESKLVAEEKNIKKNLQDMLPNFLHGTNHAVFHIVGFVPDHLEWGCRQGVYVVQVSSGPLQAHWVLPGYAQENL